MAKIKNNPLRKSGFVSQITAKTNNIPSKDFQVQEIIKCGKDPLYFTKNYVKISHPMKGLIPFKTFEYQDDCVKQYQKTRFVIVNKSRQLGLSTVSAAYALWMAIFQREKNILVIATKLDVAKLFIKKVDDMLRSLPDWLVMPHVTIHSVKEIGFSNGSRIKATPTSLSAARGEALSLVVIDECAHIEGIDEMWLALWPTLSTGGSAILISTPKGVGNLFHRIWTGAQTKENEFCPIELPWTVHPERNQEWFESEKKQIIAAMGERGVQQELLCAFNGSGDTFIPGTVLDLLTANARPPKYNHPLCYDLQIWEEPNPASKYIISSDIASGSGKDYTTFHIFDITNDTIVGEFMSNKMSVEEYSKLLMDIGREYNTALLCPELNAYGLIVSQKLKDANYPNLYYDKYRNIFSAYMQNDIKPQDLPGIITGPKNRDEMLAKLETVLRNGHLRINSKRLIEELKTFVWKGNRAEAMKGYHDDLIMSLAIGVYIFNTSGQSKYTEEDYANALRSSIIRSNVSLTAQAGGYVAQQNQFVPPIFNSNTFQSHQTQNNINPNPFAELKKQQQQQNLPQGFDPNNPFAWLLR